MDQSQNMLQVRPVIFGCYKNWLLHVAGVVSTYVVPNNAIVSCLSIFQKQSALGIMLAILESCIARQHISIPACVPCTLPKLWMIVLKIPAHELDIIVDQVLDNNMAFDNFRCVLLTIKIHNDWP
eukprot:11989287-Ditylum_brightwellii.AAC.1